MGGRWVEDGWKRGWKRGRGLEEGWKRAGRGLEEGWKGAGRGELTHHGLLTHMPRGETGRFTDAVLLSGRLFAIGWWLVALDACCCSCAL